MSAHYFLMEENHLNHHVDHREIKSADDQAYQFICVALLLLKLLLIYQYLFIKATNSRTWETAE